MYIYCKKKKKERKFKKKKKKKETGQEDGQHLDVVMLTMRQTDTFTVPSIPPTNR